MKALELAKMFGNCDRWTELKDSHYDQAAAELRRLAEVNAELVKALELAEQWIIEARDLCGLKANQTLSDMRAAVAKAKAL